MYAWAAHGPLVKFTPARTFLFSALTNACPSVFFAKLCPVLDRRLAAEIINFYLEPNG